MSQVLETMKNYVLQLNACSGLRGCLIIQGSQGGSWYTWTMRMMFYSLEMIRGSKLKSSVYSVVNCS